MLLLGDCRKKLLRIEECSVDSCVTDCPYELGFMGKSWDNAGVSFDPETWRAVYDVLKPGAYLLAFGGTRTWHRIGVAVEDAGFEIRDTVMWLYGQGFPKSLDISKAIDKEAGAERRVVGKKAQPSGSARFNKYRHGKYEYDYASDTDITAAATPEAQEWEGWGTALKPAVEPIIMARKPLSEKTVAQNVLRWGTGGLNIDGSRIGSDQTVTRRNGASGLNGRFGKDLRTFERLNPPGRFPSNVILDEEAGAILDRMSGTLKSGVAIRSKSGGNNIHSTVKKPPLKDLGYADSGGASRFFYCPKASKAERELGCGHFPSAIKRYMANSNGTGKTSKGLERFVSVSTNNHPTVKPVSLMRYLIKMVTPDGGTVLDPFIGSGTTGIAALMDGYRIIGIEQDPDHYQLAKARIDYVRQIRRFIAWAESLKTNGKS